MSSHPSPLKFLAPGWFSIVMGLCGLALAWHQASTLLGDVATAGAVVLAALAGLAALALTVGSVLRWQRYPKAWEEDRKHPVRHVFVATMPVSLLLLATAAHAFSGPSLPVQGVWLAGSVWQFVITLQVLARWLDPSVGGSKPGATFWPGITPALLIPVAGNVLAPLAGVSLGFGAWSIAQFGVGLFFWPLVLALLIVRIGVAGLWPERLLPTTFITIAPPSVVGVVVLQLGAPASLAWVAWGVALFFTVWSAGILKRAISQPFAVSFWALSFPLAAFSALTLRLAPAAPGWFQTVAMALLALSSLVVAVLALSTVKGLRDGSLLAPEPLAVINPVAMPSEKDKEVS